MPRRTKPTAGAPPRAATNRPVRRRTATTIGGMPAWSGLPTETQAALTNLMTRLILEHADQSPDRLDDGGRP